jgi:hypothetical protein
MFPKTTFALAIIVATASGALAATKHQSIVPNRVVLNQDVYDMRGKYIGSDPDTTVRFEMRRDSDHSRP